MASFIETKENITIEPAPNPSNKKIKYRASSYLKQNSKLTKEKRDASTCTADLGLVFYNRLILNIVNSYYYFQSI